MIRTRPQLTHGNRRRVWLAVFVGILVLLLGACEWPQYRFGPAHTGFNPIDKTVGVGNVANLAQAWKGTTRDVLFSSPTVTQGVVYVGSEDGTLYAFRAVSPANCSDNPRVCEPLWTATTSGAILSTPAVVNGVVYVASFDKNLYAFDAAGASNCSGYPKTCAPLWTASTIGSVNSSPTVSNGVVYITSPGPPGLLYAFDGAGVIGCSGSPKACAPLWTANVGNDVRSSPAVADGIVYVGSDDHNLYAFDAAGNNNCSGNPTKTCAPLWSASAGDRIWSSPAVADGIVYIGSNNGNLYAFDAAGVEGCSGLAKTCTPLWTASTGGLATSLSSPAIANGVAYIGSVDGRLYAFDAAGTIACSGHPKTCTPLWTAATTGPIRHSSPAVANGVVYIGSQDHSVYAFDAAGATSCSGSPTTCTPLWSAPTGSGISSSPTVGGPKGGVYVASLDGSLYAFLPPAA